MPQTAFILIVTNVEAIGERLHELLRADHGHSCNTVTTLDEALASIRRRAPDVVVAAARVAGLETTRSLVELLDRLAPDATLLTIGETNARPAPEHIAHLSLPDTDQAEDVVEPISRAAGEAVGRRQDRLLQKSMHEHEYEVFEGMVGDSPAIKRIVERIRKAAASKLTVLILGETGTGKELIAEAIHNRSGRAKKPFKPVNCAGLSETLLESELFGHVKGSFTGAVSDRKGYFSAAEGGTLFLDEVGDMPLPMQAKLLRALDRREITPVGSTDIRTVDVRVVAATHVDLRKRIEEGRFREDLYYRLNQWVIPVPPLRERRQDIPLLTHHLLRRVNEENDLHVDGFSSEALGYLAKYYWPGNVRELKNAVERAAWEAEDRRIEAEDLPEDIRGSREIVPAAGGMAGLTLAQMERIMIERALTASGGNREQAAKMLGIGTRTLYRKIKEYGL